MPQHEDSKVEISAVAQSSDAGAFITKRFCRVRIAGLALVCVVRYSRCVMFLCKAVVPYHTCGVFLGGVVWSPSECWEP